MKEMLWKFAHLALSRPLLTLKLARPKRIKKAILALITNSGNLPYIYRRYQQVYSPSANITTSSDRPFTGRGELIVFPVIDWHFRFQRPQHMATELAKLGYRVFYLATTPLMKDVAQYYKVQQCTNDNLFLVQLASGSSRLPDIHRDRLTRNEINGYAASLDVLWKKLNVKDPVAILHHPFWYPLVKALRGVKFGYDCFDQHSGFFRGGDDDYSPEEDSLIRDADFVIASSASLVNRITRIRYCALVRNGCEFERFGSLPRKSDSRRPVAGYVGAISQWFDVDLIAEVAMILPGWNFVLVGSTAGCRVSRLARLHNVTLVGEVDYEQIPGYIASFDVCLIPFKINALTKATDPVKLYEYLAAGRPVVATPLPELSEIISTGLFISAEPAAFARDIERARMTARNVAAVDEWKRWASGHDWSGRASAFASIIEDVMSRRQSGSNE